VETFSDVGLQIRHLRRRTPHNYESQAKLLTEMTASQKLQQLLADKASELSEREEQLKHLSASTQVLKNQIEGIQESLRAVQSADGEPLSQNGQERGGKLTPAVLSLVEAQGTAPGLLPSEIVNFLLEHGFEGRDRRQFYASVYPVCQRLASQGRIKEGTKRGRRSFMRVEPV